MRGDNRREEAELAQMHEHLHDVIKLLESFGRKMGVITKQQEQIMASVADLKQLAVDTRAAIDAEQEQIAAAFAALDAKVADLTAQIVAGGTDAERQAVADDLVAAIADVKSTIADAAPPPAEPPVA